LIAHLRALCRILRGRSQSDEKDQSIGRGRKTQSHSTRSWRRADQTRRFVCNTHYAKWEAKRHPIDASFTARCHVPRATRSAHVRRFNDPHSGNDFFGGERRHWAVFAFEHQADHSQFVNTGVAGKAVSKSPIVYCSNHLDWLVLPKKVSFYIFLLSIHNLFFLSMLVVMPIPLTLFLYST
jgi:hypothetical protein